MTDSYVEGVYEQFFNLKYYGGWSFTEAFNLPVPIRIWFLKRLEKQKEVESEQLNNSGKQTKNQGTKRQPPI